MDVLSLTYIRCSSKNSKVKVSILRHPCSMINASNGSNGSLFLVFMLFSTPAIRSWHTPCEGILQDGFYHAFYFCLDSVEFKVMIILYYIYYINYYIIYKSNNQQKSSRSKKHADWSKDHQLKQLSVQSFIWTMNQRNGRSLSQNKHPNCASQNWRTPQELDAFIFIAVTDHFSKFAPGFPSVPPCPHGGQTSK